MGQRIVKLTSLMLASVGGCGATYAQEAKSETQVGAIQDIVVVATRREERLQDVPVTVTAITGDTLAESGIKDVRSLTQVIPAFHGGRFQAVMQPNIRGVGSSGVSVGDESNVAVYVDGVYQGDPYSTQIDLVEISRVEVLRGPQGTVFGRNATGGLVNVITPDPKFEYSGMMSAKYGRMRRDSNEYDLRAYLTGPISDKVAFDISALYTDTGGYTQDIFHGGTVGDARKAYVRGKLLFQPSDSSSLIVTAGYVDSKDKASTQQPYKGNSAGLGFGAIIPTQPWTTSSDIVGLHAYDRLDLSLRTRFELGSVNLETTGAYMRTRVHQIADSDSSNLPLGYSDMHVKADTFTQEVRLLSAGSGPLTWIAGAYYYHLKGRQPVDVLNNPSLNPAAVTVNLSPRAKTESLAGFVEGTYALTDRFFATAGARYTTEKRTFSQFVNGTQLPFGEVSRRFNKFNYRVALRYELSDKANIYGSFGTGYKSGVFNTLGTSSSPVSPENIYAAEIGLKADPKSWLRTNLAIYHYTYKNMQLNARTPANTQALQNAADSEIYGGELEVTTLPTRNLSIRASATYNHTEFKSFPGAQIFTPKPTGGNTVSTGDVSGNRLYRAPRYTLTLGVNQGFDVASGRGHIAANIFHSGKLYYDFLNIVEQKAYTMVNGELGWTTPDDRWAITLFASNLTNAKVAQHIAPASLSTYITYERPRQVGLSIAVRF